MKTFDAFLCHSTRADGELVAKMRQELQMHSRRFFGLRRLHLFQDRFDLGDTPTLWPTLVDRLTAAKKLVVVLTHESEHSSGMAAEIAWWLENRDPKDLCLVALSGELWWNPSEEIYPVGSAIPTLLQTYYQTEPFFFDLRGYRGQHKKADSFVGDTFWALLANLLGTTADAVRRQDRKRRRLEVTSAATGLAVLAATGVVALNAWANVQVEGALRIDAERRIDADRMAAQSLALIDRDPGESARSVLKGTAIRVTPQTAQAMHKVALRWPFLSNYWSINRPVEAITVEQGTGLVYLCGGSQLWTVDLQTGSAPTQAESLAMPDAQHMTSPRCRFETAPGGSAKFLVVEFVVTSDDAMNTALPSPTVYHLQRGIAKLLHMGMLSETASTVCASDSIEGLSFIRDGSVWLCRRGAPHRLFEASSHPQSPHSLIEAPSGLKRGFLQRSLQPRSVGRGIVGTPDASKQSIVVFDPKSGDHTAQEIDVAPGVRLTALAPGGAEIGMTGFHGNGSTARLGYGPAAFLIDLSSSQQDVDSIHFPNAFGARWTVYSSPYSGREFERSFLEYSDRNGSLRFERFGGFRETPSVIYAPAPGHLLVATRAGRLEHYRLDQQENVVRRLSPPSVYRRFNACAPVSDANGVEHMLVSTPSGGLFLMRTDDPAQHRTISHRLSHGAYFTDDDPKQLEDAMADDTPDWLLQYLETRWIGVQAFRAGLTQFESSDDGSILATMLADGESVGVVMGNSTLKIKPPQGTMFNQHSDAALTVSPDGTLLTVPTQAALAIYNIDRQAGTVIHSADMPSANATAISADGTRLALARDLEIEVRRLDCGDNLDCLETPESIEYRFEGHNNGIMRIAFDRKQPLLYSAGHDGRFVVHDLESGMRLDADMPLHADTIESLCALPNGGALSQDQSQLMLNWRFGPTTLSQSIKVLEQISSPVAQ